ncbi:protein of unknown function [Paraburkholderia dioscoreae]|uniref:Uncharacterized protein n=1 Tax=Paraburkholderia dioscoreae TaxID=2604047 RepID=A0A5Q4Z9S7_9BURK|nr:protein of unknown function [Paraburkholderia dioscoreae]
MPVASGRAAQRLGNTSHEPAWPDLPDAATPPHLARSDRCGPSSGHHHMAHRGFKPPRRC